MLSITVIRIIMSSSCRNSLLQSIGMMAIALFTICLGVPTLSTSEEESNNDILLGQLKASTHVVSEVSVSDIYI